MEQIRMASPPDLVSVEAIVEASYSVYIDRIGCKPGPMLDDYAALIAAGHVHVLDDDGVVVGLVVLIAQRDALLLDNICVHPDRQGRGYGKRLMAFAEEAALALGFSVVRLYTHQDMVENIAIYTRAGYRETHRAEEKGLKRVYMLKQLDGG